MADVGLIQLASSSQNSCLKPRPIDGRDKITCLRLSFNVSSIYRRVPAADYARFPHLWRVGFLGQGSPGRVAVEERR